MSYFQNKNISRQICVFLNKIIVMAYHITQCTYKHLHVTEILSLTSSGWLSCKHTNLLCSL